MSENRPIGFLRESQRAEVEKIQAEQSAVKEFENVVEVNVEGELREKISQFDAIFVSKEFSKADDMKKILIMREYKFLISIASRLGVETI